MWLGQVTTRGQFGNRNWILQVTSNPFHGGSHAPQIVPSLAAGRRLVRQMLQALEQVLLLQLISLQLHLHHYRHPLLLSAMEAVQHLHKQVVRLEQERHGNGTPIIHIQL